MNFSYNLFCNFCNLLHFLCPDNRYWILRIVSKTEMEKDLENSRKRIESSDDGEDVDDDFPSQNRNRNLHRAYINQISSEEEEEEENEEIGQSGPSKKKKKPMLIQKESKLTNKKK